MSEERDSVSVEEYIDSGDLQAALDSLRAAIRDDSANAELHSCLFQLLCVMGDWDGAMVELDKIAEMDSDSPGMVQTCGELLACEIFRAEVFSGNCDPLLFGETNNWLSTLMRSLEHTQSGNGQYASELIMEAMEHAVPRSGTINNEPFSWLSDADMRLGPVFEINLDGKYYWVPIDQVAEVSFSEPMGLRDLVWLPIQVLWVSGDSSIGFMPTRYPGAGTLNDPQSALARKTDWTDIGDGFHTGSGQRMFTTENDEYALLQTRRIVFDTVPGRQSSQAETVVRQTSRA